MASINWTTSQTTQSQAGLNVISIIKDLNFAIGAGDNEFAPAIKLVLYEAITLANNVTKLDKEYYERASTALRSTYSALLREKANNPVAQQVRLQYSAESLDALWDYLEQEAEMENITNPNIIVSNGNVNKNAYFVAKRIFDILATSAVLLLIAPFMIFIAILIKLDSPGPVFYIAKRTGSKRHHHKNITFWEQQDFDFYKFRSMKHMSDDTLHRKYIENWMKGTQEISTDNNAQFKLVDDPRVTKIGAFIRRTSIDELPQLFNVLRGNMSLVGPRPVPVYEAAQYTKEQAERLASVPGITGLWQVTGRGQTTFEEQVQIDLDYIHNQTLMGDIKILVQTVPAVLKGDGAR